MRIATLDRFTQSAAERAAIKLFDEPGQQWGGQDCQNILRDWLPRLLERADCKGTDEELSGYQEQIDDAFPILNKLREAFSGNVNRTLYDVVQDDLWVWPSDKELRWAAF
jgi:hypothetical protein